MPSETKYQYKIKEVADIIGETVATIRYWESRFPQINPSTNKHGTRKYTEKDIKEIKSIQYLLREKKMTIEGASNYLKDNKKERVIENSEIVEKLKNIREELLELKKQISENFPESDDE